MSLTFDAKRKLGPEAARSHLERYSSGFYQKYMSGTGLDIGFRGSVSDADTILPLAIGIEKDYPGYDGKHLPFPDMSQHFVFSSHVLEHIVDDLAAITEWHRVTRYYGHIVIIVPHRDLYEKQLRPPSKWNKDHQRFYTPASLLFSIESALPPNSYRIKHLSDNDRDFDYNIRPETHSQGCYEIECVIQRIPQPDWGII